MWTFPPILSRSASSPYSYTKHAGVSDILVNNLAPVVPIGTLDAAKAQCDGTDACTVIYEGNESSFYLRTGSVTASSFGPYTFYVKETQSPDDPDKPPPDKPPPDKPPADNPDGASVYSSPAFQIACGIVLLLIVMAVIARR